MKKLFAPIIIAGSILWAQAAQPRVAGVAVVPANFSTLSLITNIAGTNLVVLWIGGNTNVVTTWSNLVAQVTGGGGSITINPTVGALPYKSGSASFGDSAFTYDPDGSDAVINLFTDTDNDDADTAMLVQPFSSSPYGNAHIALYIENDVETPAETDFPVNSARVGNNALYAIAAPPNTNTVAIGAIGTVDPAKYNYGIGVIGVVEVSSDHASSTNIGLVASVDLPASDDSRKSVAVFARVFRTASPDTPVMENSALLLDTYDSEYPLIVGRTNNGTTTFKVLANGTTTINGLDVLSREYGAACSDLTTALATGANKGVIRTPVALTLSEVRASLLTAQSSGSTLTVDILENGVSILSTPITFDNGEDTSESAATPPVISDAAIADDAKVTVSITQVGDTTARGLQVWIKGKIAQ